MEDACAVFDKISESYTPISQDDGYLWRYLEYMLQWHKHNFDCIVFAQSPYPRPIHPSFAAALSYDPMRCSTEPPTVRELADFLCEGDFVLRDKLAWCLRDSWRLLYGGMLFVNHNLGGRGTSAALHSQCVDQVEYIVSLVAERCRKSGAIGELKVISLGTDGTQAARMLASALSKVCRVQVLQGKHPAYIARLAPEVKLSTPMLSPQHRSYMVQRVLSAAASSVRECVQVSELQHQQTGGRTHVRVPSGSFDMDSPGAESRLLSVAARLRSTFPLPIVCIGVGTHLGLEDGVGNNSIGRILECYRSWLVAIADASECAPRDSYAVTTHAMSSGRYQQGTFSTDVDATARSMNGIDEIVSAAAELGEATARVQESTESPLIRDIPGMSLLTERLLNYRIKLDAMSAAMVLVRARNQAMPHYDNVSRPYGRAGVPLRSPGSPPPAPVSIPLNSSARTFSVTSGSSSTSPAAPIVARAKRKGPVTKASASSMSVPVPPSPVQSEGPSATQSSVRPAQAELKVGSPASPATSPSPGLIRARRPKPALPVSHSTPSHSVISSMPSYTPTSPGAMSEYTPPLDEPESPSIVRIATRVRPALQQLSFSSLGAPAEVPHSSSVRVGVETPSQHARDTVSRRVQDHSNSSGTSTTAAPPVAFVRTGAQGVHELASVKHGNYKSYLDTIRFWADNEGLTDLSDALSDYIDGDVKNSVVQQAIELLHGVGEVLDVDVVKSILSPECPERFKYMLSRLRELCD